MSPNKPHHHKSDPSQPSSPDVCYHCGSAIKSGQSFYEDHNAKVCIACFRETPRCQKCKFPSKHLKRVDGFGQVCEFCYASFATEEGMTCYLCQGKIWSNASHYADHGKTICQSCFKDAKIRCFSCRFPHVVETISGHGGICEFCIDKNLNKDSNLAAMFKPLQSFLSKFGHDVGPKPNILWVNWKLVLGMQMDSPDNIIITFFDELVRYCYPVYYMKGLYYVIPSIPRDWFMPYMAGQMIAADICKKYDLFHLRGNSPFLDMARGWCHWVAYYTAKTLKYEKPKKTISRWPESTLPGNFQKFHAMSEFRSPTEIVEYAHQTLGDYAKKYL